MTKHKIRIPPSVHNTIIKKYENGDKRRDIANSLGLPYPTVVSIIRRHGQKEEGDRNVINSSSEQEQVDEKDTVAYWKDKYLKAVKILLDNDLINIDFD